jgi:hypothetical protein
MILDAKNVEAVIGRICGDLGLTYSGWHTISPGMIGTERCPSICFAVGPEPLPATDQSRLRFAQVGGTRTIVTDHQGRAIGEYSDITKATLLSCE